MKILHLTLKKKWFDMIAQGTKKEEYREIKPYWIQRLHAWGNAFDPCRDFSVVQFKNGYAQDAPTMIVECKGIEIGGGATIWGAEEGKEYYVIQLGKILSIKNYKPS